MKDYLSQDIEKKENTVNDLKKEIIKSAIITGIGAGVCVAGAFGTIHFGQAYIEALKSDETLTYGLYTLNQWKLSGLSISAIASFGGAVVSYNYGKFTKECNDMYQEGKEKIKELKLERENLKKLK